MVNSLLLSQTQRFTKYGLSWDMIAVQKVDCAPGEVVDTHSFLCVECISPTYSRGGVARECDSCARVS